MMARNLSPLLVTVLLVLIGAMLVWGKPNFREIEKKILDSILGTGRYDSRVSPHGVNNTDGPVMVHTQTFIRGIGNIDEAKMEYTVQLTFRQRWNDGRLQFDDVGGRVKYLTLRNPEKIWKPDLFFSNEKEGHFHNILMPNVLLRIYPNGDILYSCRVSLVLACYMNLKFYPLDKQTCSLIMASYGYTTDDIVFLWKEGDPVQITKNFHIKRFTLEGFHTDYCTSRTTTGEYSCLRVDLLFKREISYFLFHVYIPCCMIVIVSWVSFWLDQNAITARVFLGVTTLLTMAIQTSSINAALPAVSYIKAIDVYTGACLTFLFGAFLEFALVHYISRCNVFKKRSKEQQNKQREVENASPEIDHLDVEATTMCMIPLVRDQGDRHDEKMRQCEIHMVNPKTNLYRRLINKFPSCSTRIDAISRLFFPITFAVFNLVYWTTYRIEEDFED